MKTSETRSINQCTYEPIYIRNRKATLFEQPHIKRNILANVFDNREFGEYIIGKLSNKSIGESSFNKIIKVIHSIWINDFKESTALVRDLDMDSLVQFVKDAFNVGQSLIEQSIKDLSESALNVAERANLYEKEFNGLPKEISSLIKEVKELVKIPPSDDIKNKVDIAKYSSMKMPSESKLNTINESELKESFLYPQLIYKELSERSPETTAFLKTINYLPSSYNLSNIPFPLDKLKKTLIAFRQTEKKVDMLINTMKIHPVGYLHLERLQYTPIGYEIGELVYSLPMLPHETVRLSHREWSKTESEFEKLVITSLETASEEALSEKTELTDAVSTEQQHSSGYNASVSASGSYGPTFSITTGFNYNESESESKSKQSSSKKAQEVTKKASSRAKQEHKISFKVTTTHETEEQSFREITNQLDTPVTWYFHRLMKKWRIDLYRYDLRMTYDIVIPEPGSYLLRKYILLKQINEELKKANPFSLSPSSITRDEPKTKTFGQFFPFGGFLAPFQQNLTSWEALSQKYGVALDSPPEDQKKFTFFSEVKPTKDQREGNGYIDITLPEGYEISTWEAIGELAQGAFILKGKSYNFDPTNPQSVQDALNKLTKDNFIFDPDDLKSKVAVISLELDLNAKNLKKIAPINVYKWEFKYRFSPEYDNMTFSVGVIVTGKLTNEAYKDWQMKCYEQLVDAAQAQYESKQLRLEELRDELMEELDREDALMLRKLEKEELMKGVLRWILGPNFSFYPKNKGNGSSLPNLTLDEQGNLDFFDVDSQSVKEEFWETTLQYGELIKFLHEAIEWENVNYVLYPYFWTDPNSERWDFKQFLYHKDYIHRSFLRAGAARVVLTLRRGFEGPFLNLMEAYWEGAFNDEMPDPETYPYITLAKELEDLAKTKYPYTPDANIEKEEYLFSWENIQNDLGEGENDIGENARLRDVLAKDFYIEWIFITNQTDNKKLEKSRIEKFVDEKKIRVSRDFNSVEIIINEKDEKATLKITDGRTYDLKVKKAEGKLKIYKEQNWVDTWYEFTPTGALNVSEGTVQSPLTP